MVRDERKSPPAGGNHEIKVIAPGRLCLIGEHQDYFGLEVISGALSLSVELRARRIPESCLKVHLLKTNQSRELNLRTPQPSPSYRDYLQSGLNLMLAKGFRFMEGYEVEVSGSLPIGKGVSSSSALCVAWIAFLAAASESRLILKPAELARLAFHAEVVSFDEPGGMQDHIASAYGGLLHMDFKDGRDVPLITRLTPPSGDFLLVDSGSVKETLGMIASIRKDVEKCLEMLCRGHEDYRSLQSLQIKEIPAKIRSDSRAKRLLATLINRNITRYAKSQFLNEGCIRNHTLGKLMRTHHRILSRLLQSSSPFIDELCAIAIAAGAEGAKVIGSGGGGCLLVYAAAKRDEVVEALQFCRVKIELVGIGWGAKVEDRR
jgi:galactokinase